MIFRIVNPTGDKIAGATYEKKSGALQCLISLRRAPVGFADGTAATPITGAPAAYCFYVRDEEPWPLAQPHGHVIGGQVDHYGCVPRPLRCLVPRNIIGTSRFSTERYHASAEKRFAAEASSACKYWQTGSFRLFSIVVNA